MKNEILYLLLNEYADHEPAFLGGAISCDERSIKEHPKYINKILAPTLDEVRSCSGFRTLHDYSFESIPEEYAADPVSPGGFRSNDFAPVQLSRWFERDPGNLFRCAVLCCRRCRICPCGWSRSYACFSAQDRTLGTAYLLYGGSRRESHRTEFVCEMIHLMFDILC